MREVWADANRPLPACQLSCILSLGTEWTIHKYLIFVTSSPTSAYPLVRHLPNGQTVPLLPSPVQMTSVISVSHFKNVKIVLFILFLCYLFTLSICFSLSLSLSLGFVAMWSLRGQWTQCLTSLGFQDLQLVGQAVGHPPHLDTVWILRRGWWDNESLWRNFFRMLALKSNGLIYINFFFRSLC